MMSKKSKYSRRTSVSVRRSEKVTIIITVAVLVVLAATAAVVAGNLLKRKIDTLDLEKKEEDTDPVFENWEENADVDDVKAFYYDYSSTAASFTKQGIYDFSVCLRSESGDVGYNSATAEKIGLFGFDKNINLEENVSYIKNVGGYACGYFFVSSHTYADENIRRVMQAYEISLICESAEAGVEDIMLMGMIPDASNIEYLCKFISDVKKAVGDRANVGVALNCATMLQGGSNLYFVGRLGKSCDFLGLDLHSFEYSSPSAESGESDTSLPFYDSDTGAVYASNPKDLLANMRYYIKGYSMRIIFNNGDSSGIEAAEELGFTDYQTVK